MLERREIEKLRDRGLTEATSLGAEAVRVTAQHRRDLTAQSRQERRDTLRTWERELEAKLAPLGVEMVPESLSVAGQTVEALVPVASLNSLARAISGDVRLDIVAPRQVVEL